MKFTYCFLSCDHVFIHGLEIAITLRYFISELLRRDFYIILALCETILGVHVRLLTFFQTLAQERSRIYRILIMIQDFKILALI